MNFILQDITINIKPYFINLVCVHTMSKFKFIQKKNSTYFENNIIFFKTIDTNMIIFKICGICGIEINKF